jgi:ABC-2 type transport system ATP-binding protein
MSASDQYVIDPRGLMKAYAGVAVLKGLNLKVPKHSIFGFLGPNGAGKSTTIKLLLGVTRPTAGTATVSTSMGCRTCRTFRRVQSRS